MSARPRRQPAKPSSGPTDESAAEASPSAAVAAPRRVPRAIGSRFTVTLFLALAASITLLDLATKWAAFRYVADRPVVLTPEAAGHSAAFWAMYPHEPIRVIPGVLSLRLTTNPGAIFGLGDGGRWVFVAVSVIAAGLILFLFARSPRHHRLTHAALAAILAGALGNLHDRFWYGQVRDLLWLFPDTRLPFGWSWPGGARSLYPWIFNIADVALVLGVVTILIITLARDLRQGAKT